MMSISAYPLEEENTPTGSNSSSLVCVLLNACTIWDCVTEGEKQCFKKGVAEKAIPGPYGSVEKTLKYNDP